MLWGIVIALALSGGAFAMRATALSSRAQLAVLSAIEPLSVAELLDEARAVRAQPPTARPTWSGQLA
jgi:hypothetical protein